MAYTAKEYSAKLIVSKTQIKQMARAQKEVYASGIINLNSNKLTTSLSVFATVLGLIFVRLTPAGVVLGVASLLLGLSPSQKDSLAMLVNTGNNSLDVLGYYFDDHPQYDLIEVELPFIEYTVDGEKIRFATGKGLVHRIHTQNGWIVL